MFWNWIEIALLIWFLAFLLHFKFNSGYYVRKWTGIKQTRSIKLLDCFPCQSFWITLLTIGILHLIGIELSILTAPLVYFMAVVTDKNK